jgi:hypothetical protein
MDIQAHLPPALAALHNFIWKHDLISLILLMMRIHSQGHTRGGPAAAAEEGQLAEGLAEAAEKQQANERWDRIAWEMWTQYQAELL